MTEASEPFKGVTEILEEYNALSPEEQQASDKRWAEAVGRMPWCSSFTGDLVNDWEALCNSPPREEEPY